MVADLASVTARVLIIEDNSTYAEKLTQAFASNHQGVAFETKVAESELAAHISVQNEEPDVCIVDLQLPEFNEAPSEEVGERLVKRLSQNTDAGVIVHTGMTRMDREDFLWGGVDDYIKKGEPISELVARTFAVWRRASRAKKPAMLNKKMRTFRIGKWLFEEGNRTLLSREGGTARLSPTELAFMQYLCTVDTEIDRREFNVAVLARSEHKEDMRIDNLVYRLREKLGGTFQLISRNNGAYKLISIEKAA
jgi:DNA-binding response OmpR family regulator